VVLHLSEPSSATVISRLQDRHEAQLAADAAAAKFKHAPFWSEPSDVVSHSTYNPPLGGVVSSNSSKSEAVDRLLATLEQVQPAPPPSRPIVASLKGLGLVYHSHIPHTARHAASLTQSPGKYYELIDACSELDTRALGALSRADFQRALSSSSLGLQPSEVCLMPKSIFRAFPTSPAGGGLDANDQKRKH
jgi:hypothetical protein